MVVTIGFSRNAMNKANFNASINKFISDFSYARQLASMLNRYVAVVFDKTGTFYTIRTQDSIGNFEEGNFTINKKYTQPNEQVFFDHDNTRDIMINSLGLIREFPSTANDAPVTITLDFIQKSENNWGTYQYLKRVTIYPSGGLKIETINK